MEEENKSQKNFREEIISIKGMHCKSCTESIESKIKELKGVENIKVSLIENKAFVKFDPEESSLEEINKAIKEAGYSTVKAEGRHNGLIQGLIYGLIPHTGCIAFIAGSILGVTFLTQLFKPLLMSRYFFYGLFLISLSFATLSAALYLRKNGMLSSAGAKRKWKYLTTMYGSTIGINLIFFMFLFPMLANIAVASPSKTGLTTGTVQVNNNTQQLNTIKLQVDIPCSGHAPLISQELKSINGVTGIQFSSPNVFDVQYDPAKTSRQQILSLAVFSEYRASVLSETALQQNNTQLQEANNNTSNSASPPGGGFCSMSGNGSTGCGCG